MSISGISSSSYLYELYLSQNSSASSSQSASQSKKDRDSDPIKADLAQLWQALQSGDLTSAQSIFTELQSDVQAVGADAPVQATIRTESADSTGTNPLANDLSQLESALESGDTEGAKQILATIIQHMQPPGGGPPPPSGSEDSANNIIDELKALGQALQSGDLTSAQSIFSQLQSDVQAIGSDTAAQGTTGTGSADSTGTNPLVSDFSALEDAIGSNDITSANEYLLKIMQHIQQPGLYDTSGQLDILT